MSSIEQFGALSDSLRSEVRALAARLEADAGAPPLNDQSLLQLAQSRPGLVHLIAREDQTSAGSRTLAGYAQLDDDGAELAASAGPAQELLPALEAAAAGPLTVWTHGNRSPVAPLLHQCGYRQTRVLHQLRMPLTEPITDLALPDGVRVRPFAVGSDEAAWLQLNAAAFAEHTEQGSWTLADLTAREAEPWFDPAGFLLAWRGADLLGFHWTKTHPDGSGEVYVLGVGPAAQGLGLGGALLAAGLRHLADRGCPLVLLYVDDSNSSALRLYERFGFQRYDVDTQWRSPGS